MSARVLCFLVAVGLQGSAAQQKCADSETWHKKNSVEKDCDWVSDFHWKRCRAKGQDNTFAWFSCPATCSACSCEDVDDWHVEDESAQDCAWVADFPPNRCQAKGADGTFAYRSCPRSCSAQCFEETAAPSAAPSAVSTTQTPTEETYAPTAVETYGPTEMPDNGGDCEDSGAWHKKNMPSQNCEWVADWPARCQARGEDGTHAWWACPGTCSDKCRESAAEVLFDDDHESDNFGLEATSRGLQVIAPDPVECRDDTTWHKKNDADRTCDWVAEFPKRCRAKGQDDTFAWFSCPATCSACSCEDVDDWHVKDEPAQDCAWVADLAPNRCQAKGEDGTFAYEACPLSCSMLCEGLTGSPSALPTSTPSFAPTAEETYAPTLVETYAPTEAPDSGGDCENSEAWYKKGKPSRDCDWVAEWAPRCHVKGEDGTFAWWACPGACADECADEEEDEVDGTEPTPPPRGL